MSHSFASETTYSVIEIANIEGDWIDADDNPHRELGSIAESLGFTEDAEFRVEFEVRRSMEWVSDEFGSYKSGEVVAVDATVNGKSLDVNRIPDEVIEKLTECL
ncbi:hypothetical protein KOR42_23540 [Thalassoglobus neptunius]|uniref:Uncharacterized protein n=1 Tax=Thalassoglobus neptunius TaxID=1938619 RepID=A0A5C5X775_9PLAN|nr:hypothetical protein [Thalassoglobus neptunius]TWT58967.1 hypothetical protein KOR42_23540 [Thalassoglobus neptunius]